MDRTACTEPQCLYNGALYLFVDMNGATNDPINNRILNDKQANFCCHLFKDAVV